MSRYNLEPNRMLRRCVEKNPEDVGERQPMSMIPDKLARKFVNVVNDLPMSLMLTCLVYFPLEFIIRCLLIILSYIDMSIFKFAEDLIWSESNGSIAIFVLAFIATNVWPLSKLLCYIEREVKKRYIECLKK